MDALTGCRQGIYIYIAYIRDTDIHGDMQACGVHTFGHGRGHIYGDVHAYIRSVRRQSWYFFPFTNMGYRLNEWQ